MLYNLLSLIASLLFMGYIIRVLREIFDGYR